ncbi:MAG: WYL domain-containing protein [Candidatus Nanopelagicales bacterium]
MTALQSLARIHRVMALLHGHPEGLPLDFVAATLEVDPATLRREILEYYATDIPPEALMGLSRAESLEFLAADGAEADPHLAPVIRAVTDRPEAELGVEYLRADELVALYEAALGLATLEPDNHELTGALTVLSDTFLGRVGAQRRDDPVAGLLRQGLEERRGVRIEYSRAWRPGVSVRDIQPYALRHTSRGWEVDAGPLVDGRARTYIVDRIVDAELLDGRFERPEGVDDILAAERAAVRVVLSLPQRTHWVADRFAESTEVLAADSDDLTVAAHFLPPVAERVGLILIIAGPQAFVLDPPTSADAGADLAARLLAHHGLDVAEP